MYSRAGIRETEHTINLWINNRCYLACHKYRAFGLSQVGWINQCNVRYELENVIVVICTLPVHKERFEPSILYTVGL